MSRAWTRLPELQETHITGTPRSRTPRLALLLAGALLAAGLPERAAAQLRSLEIVGQLAGGGSWAVEIGEPQVYAGIGQRLVVFDLADPDRPTQVGMTEILPDNVRDIERAGDLLYIALDEAGLGVIDVGDPRQPQLLARLPLPVGSRASAVELSGDYALVAGWTGSFSTTTVWTFDIRDPSAPRPAGVFQKDGSMPYFDMQGFGIAGQRAFLAYGDVAVLDISDPTAPRDVSTFGMPWYTEVTGIELSGGLAFVGAPGGAELRTYDIADPDQPKHLSSTELVRLPLGVTVHGGRAYVTMGSQDSTGCGTGDDMGHVQVIDVTDRAAPRNLGAVAVPDAAYDAAILDPAHVFVAAGAGGLRLLDLTDPAQPVDHTDVLDPIGYVDAVRRMGDHVFLAERRHRPTLFYTAEQWRDRIVAVDVRDPARPKVVGQIPFPRWSSDPLAAADGMVYAASRETHTLHVIDARNPSRMIPTGSLALDDDAHAIEIAGSHVFVAVGSRVDVVDVQDPAAPRRVAALDLPGLVQDLAVDGDLAYAAARQSCRPYCTKGVDTLVVMDIGVPDQSRPIGRLRVFENLPLSHVTAAAGFAFVNGFLMVDARKPAQPQARVQLNADRVGYGGRTSLLQDGRLYAVAEGCLGVFEVADPMRPNRIAALASPGDTATLNDLAVTGDTIYLAPTSGGLLVAQLGGGSASPPTGCGNVAWQPARPAGYLPFVGKRRN